jgi:2-polyprenyl-3-methyl-5-hydroxy-6-metoxy-1,4-benzoquinol methylase
MQKVIEINPHSILDIGCGFGKYGVLCREYLEFWGTGRPHNKIVDYTEFKRRIDCIDAFPHYITSLHKFIYDNIYIEDITRSIATIFTTPGRAFHYDLVLMIDVIEHMEKLDAKNVIGTIFKNSSTTKIIISTPKGNLPQGAVFSNPYEQHRSSWTVQDLTALASTAGSFVILPNDQSHIIVLS